jgi:S-methylmethionine-dependent homocysteine/selenocysteine methylase
MRARPTLPQLTSPQPYITDGGLETTLVFRDGIDLADFAAFPLLDTEPGRAALARYYLPYIDLAERLGVGMVVDTPTWRANPDWGSRLGYAAGELAAVNQRAVTFVSELAAQRTTVPTVINGVVGPRGDGYLVDSTMSPSESATYHGLQARSLAEAGAEMISAITMTHAGEAIGVAQAANAVGLPSVISLTVETDGRLPSGQPLGEAIFQIDDATHGAPAYYMVNCAHPTHFSALFDTAAEWTSRIHGIRANASRLSHAQLDETTELDRGDIDELASLYGDLGRQLDLRVVGGCCGTDDEHVAAIANAIVGSTDGVE